MKWSVIEKLQNTNKCLLTVGIFFFVVLALSIIIKVIALFLDLLARGAYLNTLIVICSIIIVLAIYCGCCPKSPFYCCKSRKKKESGN